MDADGLGRGRRGGEHREHLRQRPRIALLPVAWADVLIECPGGPGAPRSGKVEELLEDMAFQFGQGLAGRRWELGALRWSFRVNISLSWSATSGSEAKSGGLTAMLSARDTALFITSDSMLFTCRFVTASSDLAAASRRTGVRVISASRKSCSHDPAQNARRRRRRVSLSEADPWPRRPPRSRGGLPRMSASNIVNAFHSRWRFSCAACSCASTIVRATVMRAFQMICAQWSGMNRMHG